jgi:hypothetical protein
VFNAGTVAFALTLAVCIASAMPASINAYSSSEAGGPAASATTSAQLVTQEELCAFRAPLFVDADEVPATCLSVVEWLRRVINDDMECGDMWLQRGEIPECALPYR